MKVLNFHSGIIHTSFNELFFHTILLKPVAFHFLNIDLIFPRHLFNCIVLIHFHHVDELAISLYLFFVDKFSLAIDSGFLSQNGLVEKILLFGLIFLILDVLFSINSNFFRTQDFAKVYVSGEESMNKRSLISIVCFRLLFYSFEPVYVSIS